MIKIHIKPLSVNKAYRGRRYKTKEYKEWQLDFLSKVPKIDFKIPEKIELSIEYGFSSKGSDIDNPTKVFLDVLSDVYNFNDNKVYKLILTKQIVKKGSEYIKYNLKEIK